MGDRERERDRMGWQPRERDRDRRGSWQPPHYDNGPRPPTGYSHNRIDSWQPERDHVERGRDREREREHDRDRDYDREHDRDYERRDGDWQGPDGAHGPNKRRRGGRRQKEKMAQRDRERERERERDGDHWEPGRPPPQDLDRRGGRGFPPPDAGYANRVRQPSPIARPMRERSASPWARRAPRSGPPSDGEITRSHTGSFRRSRSPRSPSRSRTESVRGRGGSRSKSRSRSPLRNPSEMDTSAVIHEPYVLGSPSPPMEEPPALPPPPPPQTSSYQRHELPPRPSLDLPPRPSTSQTASPAPHTIHHQLPPRPSVHIATASSSYVASPASASAPTPAVRSSHAGAHSQQQQPQQQQHQQQQQAQQLPRHSNIDPVTGLPIATTLANNPNRGKKPREGHNPYGSKNEEARAPPTAEELEKMRKEREDSEQRANIWYHLNSIAVRKGANTAALNRLMENKVKEINLKHQIAVLGIERRVLELRKQLAEDELARAQRGTWDDEIDMSWS